ncbi:unnamed protein product [Kluyveromyces dobzhanskii CBS 2104]|uniref:WGS project CCBQ000000000 data, contig 00102 n=1 Tax=Kluyveromyces dobzhanskii CBS 2104 TaxID=1427455 RepID=A0A0A8L6Q9_9SACH|nr:unnamed protein product [Kluyveromyces dobzhanskii CBS 2104]
MTMTEAEAQTVPESKSVTDGSEVEAIQKSFKNMNLNDTEHLEVAKLDDKDDVDAVLPEEVKDESSPEQEQQQQQGEPNCKVGSGKKEHHQSRAERLEKQIELDSRSIFVGNITTEATAETLEEHFKGCGEIVRVTILYNKVTGAPKGYAYVEFESSDSIPKALELKDSELDGETINVAKKRTNVPGYKNNKNFYPRKEWVYPGWQGNVVRQWYYPYTAPGYQNYKPNGMSIAPPLQNAFYPQYPYIPRQNHNPDYKTNGYPRGNYRGNYRGNNYRGNYNGRRGNNYRGHKNQPNENQNHPDSTTDASSNSSPAESTTEIGQTQPQPNVESQIVQSDHSE